MPQAYITSPKRGHDSPPGPGRSPRTRRNARSSRLTSPIPLSPKELADYILERGNNATSPIIAKVVLDQHLDGRALAEFADESDSEDRLGSFSLLQDRQLADDFLRTTSTLRHKFPSPEITRSTRPSLKEIASLLEQAEVASHSPASTGPGYMTPPQLSPSIPEWDLEDPWTPEDMEIFAPTQDSVDESESDLLFSPGLRNFRHPATSSSESLRGAYSSLLRPVPPFTPENMPLLSALDMRHAPYGISPSSSQGGDVGLGDFPANTQGSLPNRQASPGDVRGGNPQTRTVTENGGLSAPRMSRNSSKRSTFEDSVLRTYSPRSSSCPPRAIRPQIVIPDSFWQLPSRPQRQYAEAWVQTDEQVPEAQPITPADITSDAEDPAFYDAKSSRSVTESVRDMDEGNDDFGDFVGIPQSGEEEHTSTHDTPKPPPTPELQPDVPTPHASTPVVSASTLPAPTAAVQRVKAEHKMTSTSPTASPLARTTSEPQTGSGKKGQSRPSVDTKLPQSSAGSSRSHAPLSAPPRPAPALQQSKQVKDQQPPKSNKPTPKSANSSSRTSQAPVVKKKAEAKEKPRNTTAKIAQRPPSPAQSRQAARVAASPAKPSVTKPDQATDKAVSESKDKNATKQDDTAEQSKTQPEVSSVPVDLTEGTGDVDASGDQSTKPSVAAELTTVDVVVPVDAATIELPQDEASNVAAHVETTEPTSLTPPKESTSPTQPTTDANFGSGDTLTNSPEAERLPSSNSSAPKPDTTAPTLLVATPSGAGETTSTNELSSEARESLESALSSSVIAETKPSESSLVTDTEKELKPEPEQSSTPADKITVTVEPSSDSSTPPPGQSSTAPSAVPDPLPPQEKSADDTEPSTSQSAPSTETTLRVDALPGGGSERETAEGFVNVESQLPDVPDQFESIDRNEAAGADEHATGEDDLENPWGDAQIQAPREVDMIAVAASAEFKQEGKDAGQPPSESHAESVGQQVLALTNAESGAEEHTGATERQTQGDDTATDANATSPENATSSPTVLDVDMRTQQSTGPLPLEDKRLPESPAVIRSRTMSIMEREISQATDSQTEDGGDDSAVEPSGTGTKKSKSQKKKEKEREKRAKQRAAEEARLKVIEDARGKSFVGQTKTMATTPENGSLASVVAAGSAQKPLVEYPSTHEPLSLPSQHAVVAANAQKKEKEEQETAKQDKLRKTGAGEGERKRIEAPTQFAQVDANQKISDEERRAQREAEAEAASRAGAAHDKARFTRPQIQTQAIHRSGLLTADLESGRRASSTPMPSPSSTRRAPDIENQNAWAASPGPRKRDGSPSSTHSKGSSVFSWIDKQTARFF